MGPPIDFSSQTQLFISSELPSEREGMWQMTSGVGIELLVSAWAERKLCLDL